MYVANISTEVILEKWHQPSESIAISFSDKDMKHVISLRDETLVINVEIDDFDVKRVLVDSGSSTDLFFIVTLLAIGKTKRDLKKV